jgi:hypothetical protein
MRRYSFVLILCLILFTANAHKKTTYSLTSDQINVIVPCRDSEKQLSNNRS